MSIRRFTPKQFLCRYPLSRGVFVYAIILLIVAILCIIVLAIEMFGFRRCKSMEENGKPYCQRVHDFIQGIAKCLDTLTKNSFAFNGTAIIYCIVLLIFQLWVIWAIKKGKASVILVWVVVTTIWLLQVFVLFLVLLIMYMSDKSVISWSLCLVFGFLGFCLAAYGIALGLGLYFELKDARDPMT